MSKLYDRRFLVLTLEQIKSCIEDLSKWSVYNGDIIFDEVAEVESTLNKVKEILDALEIQGQLPKDEDYENVSSNGFLEEENKNGD